MLVSGTRVRCYPDSNSASNLYYFTQFYEYEEIHFLARYLRPGDGFIDGGANIGTYSLMAAGIVGPGGHVVAFEPAPTLAHRFRENLALNGIDWVELHEAALADRPGVVSFVHDRDVSNRIVPASSGEVNKVSVPSTSLDESLPSDVSFAMAKLDLEGAEVAALRGATGHLAAANPPVWQVETKDHLLRDMGSSVQELLSVFFDHAYTVASYDPATNHIEFQSHRSVDDLRGRENLTVVSRSHRQDILDRLRTSRLP